MKTVDDALDMRNRLLLAAEKATIIDDQEERRKLGTIVIAGGGPTGVEIEGMLAEMRMYILKKAYPEFNLENIKSYLVDGAPVLLAPMSKKAQQYAYDALTRMGVEIKLDKLVEDYVNDAVIFCRWRNDQHKTFVLDGRCDLQSI